MAIGNTTEVTLNINSQNAKARLEELQKMTGNLTESIKKAYDAGDTKTAKALTAELKVSFAIFKNLRTKRKLL